MFTPVLVIICVLCGACGQVSMKRGMNEVGEIASLSALFRPRALVRILTNKYVLAGVVLYAGGSVFWLGALSRLDVSFLYPLASLGYIGAAVLALIFLKENVTLLRWVGIIVIVVGCFLITRS